MIGSIDIQTPLLLDSCLVLKPAREIGPQSVVGGPWPYRRSDGTRGTQGPRDRRAPLGRHRLLAESTAQPLTVAGPASPGRFLVIWSAPNGPLRNLGGSTALETLEPSSSPSYVPGRSLVIVVLESWKHSITWIW